MSEAAPELTKKQIEDKIDMLCKLTGQKQFTKAVIDAELIQHNQEILDLRNKHSKMPDTQTPAAESVVEPLKVVTPEVVADAPTQAL